MTHMLRETRLAIALMALAALAISPAGCGGGTGDAKRVASADGGAKHGDKPATQPADAEPAAGSIDPSLPKVTLQLNWFPEAEHGGYYAALAEGYYQQAGLDVKIIPGGPDTPVLQQVVRRAVTFGIVNADNLLLGRAQQMPVVALMAPLQMSPRCIMVHAKSGIRDFDDLKNMTIAMSNSTPFSYFLRKRLKLENVKVVPYSGNVAQFLLHNDYAQQAYVFSEPFVARKEGGDPQVLMVSDLGFNPYASVLFTHEDAVEDQQRIVQKMVTASVRGWAHYIESPESANKLIHRLNKEMDFDILEFGAQELRPLVMDSAAEDDGIGTMSRKRWQTLEEQLVETGQLKPGAVDVEQAYTTRFLK